ncbi:MAG: D-alanyl-D-alanine carboxypeptidase [Acidimicrobiia bacterium]
MKFRSLLVVAFLLSAILLFLSANSLLIFEQNKEISHKKFDSSYVKKNKLAFTSLTKYEDTISNEISKSRLINIVSNAIPKNSCVEAFEIDQKKYLEEPFVSLNSNTKLIPASTNKLVTASVVLNTFDPKSTLETKLLANKTSSTLTNAYIQSVGDPSFVSNTTPPARRPISLKMFEHFRRF